MKLRGSLGSCFLLAFSVLGLDAAASNGGGEDPRWFIGTEVAFLEIEAETGGRVTMSFSDTTAPGESQASFLDGDGYDSNAVAPRLFVGRRFGRHWAVTGRFFRVTESEQHLPAPGTGPTSGTNFATFGVTDRVELETTDLEVSYAFTPGPWTIDLALGGRRAEFRSDSSVFAFGVFTTGNFINLTLSNGSAFDGEGLTAAVRADYRIGDGPVHLFVSARHADIGGESDSFGRVVGSVAASPNPPLVGAATVTRNDEEDTDLEIQELQLGVVCDFQLGDSRAGGFLRAAIEVQDWELDGPPTGGAGFGGTIDELTTNSFSAAGLGQADVTGLTLTTGFTW